MNIKISMLLQIFLDFDPRRRFKGEEDEGDTLVELLDGYSCRGFIVQSRPPRFPQNLRCCHPSKMSTFLDLLISMAIIPMGEGMNKNEAVLVPKHCKDSYAAPVHS